MTTYITQAQAEAFAHRRATKYAHRTAPLYCSYAFVPHTLMDFVRDIEAAAIQHYRDSLVAGVVLPEPVAYFYHDAGSAEKANPLLHSTMFLHKTERNPKYRNETPLHTADQYRQGIADALAKQSCVSKTQEVGAQDGLSIKDAKHAPHYLCNGMRFKVANRNGEAMLPCLPDELSGRWVALVAAEDDCHLLAAAPGPKEGA